MATDTAVLVTRPAGRADALLAAIAEAGLQAVHQPLLEVAPLEELAAAERQRVIDLDQYQHVIFVSANAVFYGMALIENYWPQYPAGLSWYGVGITTANLLRARGLAPHSPETRMDSEGLLALAPLQQVAGERVLIVKGVGGRGKIAEELTARGATVEQLSCYTRNCPRLSAGALGQLLVSQRIGVILLSSGEGLDNMLTLLSAAETTKFKGISLVAPSPRVADQALRLGFRRVITADNASDAATMAALRQWQAGD